MPQVVVGVLVALLVLLACGCGGSKPEAKHARPPSEQFFGTGADMVWVFRPREKPKSVVIFLHGLGGPTEDRPDNHRPWLLHLARKGSAVIYPRYEIGPMTDVMGHTLNGVEAGMEGLGLPKAPVVVIGYSRGGRLAVEYAAVAARYGRSPKAVLSVFPGGLSPDEPTIPLNTLSPSMRLTLMVGDKDTVVGGQGARDLIQRLSSANFPVKQIRFIAVHSKDNFTADHFAPLQTTKAARDAFWTPADRMVDSVR
jgi:pimeloyl-ACP methyl ester carboxylesterase